jgi:phage FluMu gp28-like protein
MILSKGTGPMSSDDSNPPSSVSPLVLLLPFQRAVVESPARFVWANWSRQVGKSFAFSLRRILRGLKRGRSQLLLSASQRQSDELMEKIRRHCQVLRLAVGFSSEFWRGTNMKRSQASLPNGVRVIGLPANPQTVRGFTGDVFLDEFAMHRDDRAIWAAMLPTVLRGEGELDVASTPKGMKSVFYELGHNDLFARSMVTIHDAVRDGLRVDIAALRAAMGDDQLFRQEFECEFLDETTAFLTYEQIARCEEASLSRRLDLAALRTGGEELAIGVDVGRRRDLTVIWMVERCRRGLRPRSLNEGFQAGPEESSGSEMPPTRQSGSETPSTGEEVVLVTRGLIELADAPFRRQEAALREVLSVRSVRRCCIDATGLGMQLAESAVEEFGEHRVEAVTFTPLVKTDLAGRLRVWVEEGRIRIPADADIRNDWHAVERAIGAGGAVRFEADRRAMGHADRFWAAALAVRAAEAVRGPTEYVTEGHLTFARTGVW